ncbi:hypothetical protein Mcate_01550 [Meiothermus taiwanensis]|jgi:hypothetical protein|uniref:Uncharacterized protein n=1 Tax=Meiothermus taiwanensis TaxID=172827 RepID=A0A399E4X5_9DEIN|nr:hypothetical protein Mcate_01550 [Meiothermus taiwanensis]
MRYRAASRKTETARTSMSTPHPELDAERDRLARTIQRIHGYRGVTSWE